MLIPNCYAAIKAVMLQKLHFRINCRETGIGAVRLLRFNRNRLNGIKETTWAQVTR